MNYLCPLCKSPLTKDHFHKVTKIQEDEKKVQKGELEKLKKQAAAAKEAIAEGKRREKAIKLKAKQDAEAARKEGTIAERKRSERLIQGHSAKMKKLQERLKMIEKGTTPQGIGLAGEKVLVAKLEEEFPDDRIEHVGKGGDILHFVIFDSKDTGCIVYECKHYEKIENDHISQTALAKKTRQANYGILVTTGTRKGFSGLGQEPGIFIIAQAGVLTLARICRESLFTMAKQRLDAEQKEAAAKRLMDYVTSPTCKTPLEEAISQSERARKNLKKEMEQHKRDWLERNEIYQTIHNDISHVQENVRRVLDGKEPIKLEKPRFEPLMLENKI
jgi:hypothetical protein